MYRYAAWQRILRSLDTSKSLSRLAEEAGITDARLLWHLRHMRDARLVASDDDVFWTRTEQGASELDGSRAAGAGRAFPHHVVDDFEDAIAETEEGLYGTGVVQARGEHRGRLSREQAVEFSTRLLALIEEYFAPGQGDRSGIKHGFHWVLTPIDLHPLDDDVG